MAVPAVAVVAVPMATKNLQAVALYCTGQLIIVAREIEDGATEHRANVLTRTVGCADNKVGLGCQWFRDGVLQPADLCLYP